MQVTNRLEKSEEKLVDSYNGISDMRGVKCFWNFKAYQQPSGQIGFIILLLYIVNEITCQEQVNF